MICPFCGFEMETGRLFNGRRDVPLFWMPDGYENRHYLFKSLQKLISENDGVILDTVPFRSEGSWLNAQLCRKCSKVIADFNTTAT